MDAEGARPSYGWVVVGGLGATELVSWGVLVYAFSAFVVPMSAELGWSAGELNAAYAVGVGVSGLVAVPVGRLLARRGARGLMTAGSALTVLVLLAWSRTASLPVFFAVCAAAGLAMAATLYEPAFAVTTRWFSGGPRRSAQRARAVLVVTVLGGLASTVFVPLSGTLIARLGWREALVVLAVVAGVVGLPVHGLLLREPRRAGAGDGDGTGHEVEVEVEAAPTATASASATRRASFRWLAVSLASTTAAKNGTIVVLVAYLVTRGYALEHAATVAGAVGAAQVGGRLLVTAVRGRVPEHRVHGAIFGTQALVCLLPPATTGAGPVASATLWVFVVVFGLGFGLPELLRGTLVVDLYGPADFPRLNGVLSTWVVGARAAGPFLAGAAVTVTAGYTTVLLGAAALCLLGAGALLLAHRAHHREGTPLTAGEP